MTGISSIDETEVAGVNNLRVRKELRLVSNAQNR